jgi:hypothetical protein
VVVRVDASGAEPSVSLQEPDDFKAFAVSAPNRDALAATVGSFGALATDGEHVFVRIDALRELAGGRSSDPEWLASLDGMLAFAGQHGWLDEHGSVRAHVEWAS